MPVTYIIKDWDKHYECNRTRDMKVAKWVPVPVRHDGLGYNTLVGRKNGAAYLGAWLAILQVAAKCEPRGTLLRDSRTPLRAIDIAMMSRLPAEIITETLDLCCHQDIGWIETIKNEANPQEPAEKPQEGAVCLPLQGITGKGITGNNPPLPPKGELGMVGDESGKPRKPRQKLTVADRKRIRVAANTPVMERIGRWLKRRPGTPWTLYEADALAQLGEITEDDLAALEEYYFRDIPPASDIRRRDLATLLNNWSGELDRARSAPLALTRAMEYETPGDREIRLARQRREEAGS